METTEDGGIHNTTDANIQSNDFANDLYGKLESDISFEDALKNNNSNADHEMPYLDIQSPHFDKEAVSSQHEVSADTFELNGTPASRNTDQVIENEKVQEIAQHTEEVSKETVASVTETDSEVLEDEILGETSQPLDGIIGPETEEILLADSEEEISLSQSIGEEKEQQTEARESITEVSEQGQTLPQLVEEIVVEDNQSEIVDDVQYVIEEPSSDSNIRKEGIEIRESDTIVIEEISTDGSTSSVGNPPIIVVPDEVEKIDENAQTVDAENELVESVVGNQEESEAEISKSAIGVKLAEEEVVVKENDKQETTANTVEAVLSGEKPEEEQTQITDQGKTEIEKQIEEASIIIDDSEKPETQKQIEEAPIVLHSESDQESFIIIEGTEFLAEHNEAEETVKEQRKQEEKQQKKPAPCLEKMKIPHHVLGTNIEKPVRDLCSNGRVPPKPRLGVKIPYRNLTSQIVSKQEIEKVILDRARAKQQQPPAGGDLFFTKRLTQRLARKIIPEEKRKAAELEQLKKKELEEREKKKKEEQVVSIAKPAQDADLLAILEGDGDDITEVSGEGDKSKDESAEIKEWRRDVALKQLEQMPPRRRGRSAGLDQHIYKRTEIKSPDKTPVSDTTKGSRPSSIPVLQKASAEEKVEENIAQKSDNLTDEVDMEPRFSTNSVVKTYTRKRKPAENVCMLAKTVDVDVSPKKPLKTVNEQKDQKVSIDLPPNAYVTKSSRVIKRKVIWDPDEAASPIRSYKAPKSETPTPKQEKAASPPKSIEKKPPKTVHKTIEEKVKTVQKSSDDKPKTVLSEKSPQKKIHKTSLLKKPKRLTEVDRLLMDEGAVNMLYDVKTTEDQNQGKQKKRNLSTISLDKAQKELLNKTNEIKNDLQIYSTRESPKSLRKKDGTSITPPQVRQY